MNKPTIGSNFLEVLSEERSSESSVFLTEPKTPDDQISIYVTQDISLEGDKVVDSSATADISCWVSRQERARGRLWQDVGPLMLCQLSAALARQKPHLPMLTAENARHVCRLTDSLSLQLCALGSTDLLWLFSNLQQLDLSNNFLEQVQGIGALTKLTNLNLSYNQLLSLPDLRQLQQLQVLSLQRNRLERLSADELSGLDNLQVLNLAENNLVDIENIIALRILPSLKSLKLTGNPVCSGASLLHVTLDLDPSQTDIVPDPLKPKPNGDFLQTTHLLASSQTSYDSAPSPSVLDSHSTKPQSYSKSPPPPVASKPCELYLSPDSAWPALALALFPNLLYLDGSRILKKDRRTMKQEYCSLVSAVEVAEQRLHQTRTAEEQRRAAAARYQRAGVLGLDDDSLFTAMLEGDIEAQVLICLPGADKLLARYREQVCGVISTVFRSGLEHDECRQEDLRLLQCCLHEAYSHAEVTARRLVKALNVQIKEALTQLSHIEEEEQACTSDDQEAAMARVSLAETVQAEAEAVLEAEGQELLRAELLLADQVKDVLELAEKQLGEQVKVFLATAGEQFDEAATIAYTFYCRLRELATRFAGSTAVLGLFSSPFTESTSVKTTAQQTTAAKVTQARPHTSLEGVLPPSTMKEAQQITNELQQQTRPSSLPPVPQSPASTAPVGESLQEAAARVFGGEDSLTASLASLHDRHLHHLRARGSQLKEGLQGWLEDTVRGLDRKEWHRHRTRVQEINSILDEHRQQLQDALVPILQLANS